MKRNPLWDAQAQQFLKSGVLQNSLAQQAVPGAGLKKKMPAIPISMIDRPVEPPQAAANPIMQQRQRMLQHRQQQQQPAPMPMQPQQPVPQQPMQQQPAPQPMPQQMPQAAQKPFDPTGATPAAGVIGGVKRRPVSNTMPVANQGTPFQYRVSRGVR